MRHREDIAPREVDRLIVQQYDIGRTVTIGGIDTCIRGLLEYAPTGIEFAIVGVDEGSVPGRVLGRWEQPPAGRSTSSASCPSRGSTTRGLGGSSRTRRGSSRACCATGRRSSARGSCRRTGWTSAWWCGCCSASRWCTASTPSGAASSGARRTRSGGSRAGPSTSGWTGGWRGVARCVIVFNPDYAERVRQWNPRTISAPTWFDPAITPLRVRATADPYAVLWVGRLEVPKDPQLARAGVRAPGAHPSRRAVEPPGRRLRLAAARARGADRGASRGRRAPHHAAGQALASRARRGAEPVRGAAHDVARRVRGLPAGAGGGAGQRAARGGDRGQRHRRARTAGRVGLRARPRRRRAGGGPARAREPSTGPRSPRWCRG